MQKGSNGFGGVATLELDGEWVFGQCDARLLFIGLQGRLEELMNTNGSSFVIHIASVKKKYKELVRCAEMMVGARLREGWCTASSTTHTIFARRHGVIATDWRIIPAKFD